MPSLSPKHEHFWALVENDSGCRCLVFVGFGLSQAQDDVKTVAVICDGSSWYFDGINERVETHLKEFAAGSSELQRKWLIRILRFRGATTFRESRSMDSMQASGFPIRFRRKLQIDLIRELMVCKFSKCYSTIN